jgi:hypothetical protein
VQFCDEALEGFMLRPQHPGSRAWILAAFDIPTQHAERVLGDR